ncbi:hypothetical protein P5673_010614 [Acropora cervicornis]|uniref:Uncharacterized protein n=1 Tax=Acropora cervicornis TaxID=6130 RepID=A0AAD9QQG5_ACRCE|nr:hypothetical protein P5673_010614 [Acropora cervicornis]
MQTKEARQPVRMALEMHKGTDSIDDCSGMNDESIEKEKHQSKVPRRTALMDKEVMFDSEEDDTIDISEIVCEALMRSQHPRNCKQGRAVYIASSDDSPMTTDDDCLSSEYDPDDDNGNTDDDDDEDEFQSSENDEENLSTSRSKQANIFKKVVRAKNACSSASDSEDVIDDIEEQVKPTETPSEKEEGQKEGPQLLRSNGAQEQVEVDKSEKSGTTPNVSISASKAHMCMFCEQQFQKLSRHQRRRHKEEPSVAAAMKMKDGSDEQILAFEKIRLLGDYHHNCNVLALGEGELIVVRNPSKPTSQAKFLPCPHCLGFFEGDALWRHCLICQHKTAPDEKKWKKVQAEAKLLLPTCSVSTADIDAHLYKNVISSMRNDTISSVARQDQLITNFGAAILEKVGIKNANFVSQRMRQLARLLQTLRVQSKRTDACLEEFIDTSMFDAVVDAVKDLCRFDAESRLEIGIPSLALKLGHNLKRCAQVLKSSALRRKDDETIKRAKRFLDLYEADWTSKISSRSLASLLSRKQDKIEYLPLAEDLSFLRKHLDPKIVALSKVLTETKTVESWNKLAKATLARIIIFNKRRSGETATLEIEQLRRRPDWSKCSSSLKESLTPLERRLCERLDLIEISGKRSRKVPILLTPETKTAVELLIEKRPDSIPQENKFVFARATKGSLGHLRGWDSVSDNVKEIQASLKKPKEITSTKLRKYIATVSQAAALTEVDVDWLARHLGHDVRVHREFYRLHESTAELAKVCKLLMAVDSGNIKGVLGKSLAEMTVEDIPDITDGSDGEDKGMKTLRIR